MRNDLTDEGWDVTVQTDGKIVIAGLATDSVPGSEPDFVVIRLTAAGELDSSFGSGGIVIKDDTVYYVGPSARIARQPDGKIVVASSRVLKGVVLRFDARSSNSKLTSLTASAGTLNYSPGTSSYALTVGNSTTSLSVTATIEDPNAALTVEGTAAVSGSARSVAIAVGSTAIPVVVTSQDGSSTSAYTITVTRETGSVKKGRPITAKAAMATVDKTIAAGSTAKVTSLTGAVCSAAGASIKGLKVGTCRVKIAVTPKKTKATPKPKTVTTTVTLRVVA